MKKAELADVGGDAAIEAAARILHELIGRAEALAKQAEAAAQAASRASQSATAAAEKTEKGAARAGGEAKELAEMARQAAEEAIKKAEAALPRKIIGSWDFLLVVILIFLGAVTSSVLFAVALTYWR